MRSDTDLQNLNPPTLNASGVFYKQKTRSDKMNEKLKKAINWINFAGAVLSIVVKVIQEIVEILPEKDEEKGA